MKIIGLTFLLLFQVLLAGASELQDLVNDLRAENYDQRKNAASAIAVRLVADGAQPEHRVYRELKSLYESVPDLESRIALTELLAPYQRGAVAWQRDLGAPIIQIVVANDERVVLVTRHNGEPNGELRLRAVSPADGSGLWESPTPTAWGVVVGNCYICRNDGDHELMAYDLVSGKQKWRVRCPEDLIAGTGVVVGNCFICRNGSDELMAYDLVSGEEKWRVRCRSVIQEPSFDGDRVYLAGKDWIAAFDSTGRELWATQREGYNAKPLLAGDNLLTGGPDGGLLCLAKKDGALVWKSVPASPVAIDLDVVVAQTDHLVTARRLSDGAEVWSWTPPDKEEVCIVKIEKNAAIIATWIPSMPFNPAMSSPVRYLPGSAVAVDLKTGTTKPVGLEVLVADPYIRQMLITDLVAPVNVDRMPQGGGFAFAHDEACNGEAKVGTELRALRLKAIDE